MDQTSPESLRRGSAAETGRNVARGWADAPCPDDEALVVLAQGGDRQAFAALYRRYVRQMHARLFALTGHGPHLEDLVQQTFLEAYRSLSRFRGEARFSTWLTRIAINVAAQHLRRNRRKPPPQVTLEAIEQQLTAPASQLEQAEVAHAQRVLSTLPAKLRTALVLREVGELTLEEIATLTATVPSTVASRLARARDLVARALRQRGEA